MANVELENGSHLKHGEYRIERVLGQGGFGITYEAEQTSLGRRVAVKEFFMKDYCNRDDGSSHMSVPSVGSRDVVESFRNKFIREARMLAGFRHQSIVKVFDVFEENGTAYYVMEYLEGGSLQNLVRQRGRLTEAVALEYIREVADALGYIHSKDTLHLDVKPGNIMLDADGRAILIDFGISKHIDSEGHLTSSTPMCVSKGYAPLEQVAQEPGSSYSPATDIYSLGATLYCLLTGRTPLEPSALLDGLPTGELETAGVSATTIAAISAAMQVRKEDRPQSAAEFLSLLSGKAAESVQTDNPAVNDEETKVQNPLVSESGQQTVKVTALNDLNDLNVRNGHNGHDWVDLGLSVKWATCNVGATKPEEYGDYFAWGETKPKSEYSSDTYIYCRGKIFEKLLKYNKTERGTKDGKTVLDLSDDAARANWGGSWRMPTNAEFQELIDKCTWTWTTVNGKIGYKVVSKSNGNSIFLPAAGYRYDTSLSHAGSYGYYWSGSLGECYSFNARDLYFNSDSHSTDYGNRGYGRSVRPVLR